jgi:hypothetical protein
MVLVGRYRTLDAGKSPGTKQESLHHPPHPPYKRSGAHRYQQCRQHHPLFTTPAFFPSLFLYRSAYAAVPAHSPFYFCFLLWAVVITSQRGRELTLVSARLRVNWFGGEGGQQPGRYSTRQVKSAPAHPSPPPEIASPRALSPPATWSHDPHEGRKRSFNVVVSIHVAEA